MILMVTGIAQRERCAEAIRLVTGEVVRPACDLDQAFAALRNEQFSLVVVDQLLMWEADGRMADQVAVACDAAALLVTNFAICGVERIAREAKIALRRHQREIQRAREKAERKLRSELNEAVTGILLSSELALRSPGLPAPAASKIRSVYELAMTIRERLKVA